MARVTVEDCLDYVENRFDLVMLSTRRARQLANGKDALVEWDNDKPTVVALREIAEKKISEKILDEMAEAERLRRQEESAISEEELKAELNQLSEETDLNKAVQK